MKTQNLNNELLFNKQSILELNDQELNQINGGSTDTIKLTIEIATYGTWLTVL